jgi:hypothetical protein
MSAPSITSLKANYDNRKNWISWLSLGATRTVEDAEAFTLREKNKMDATDLAIVKTPIKDLDICHLRHAWQLRQIELNTVKAQQHINKLLIWFLAYDGKEYIMESLTNAIKNATNKRDMRVNIVSFDNEDTVALDDEDESTSLKIDWIVKKTNFLTQLKDCFGDMFKVRRTISVSDEERLIITLVLEFWP